MKTETMLWLDSSLFLDVFPDGISNQSGLGIHSATKGRGVHPVQRGVLRVV